jgi:hypothetical protein
MKKEREAERTEFKTEKNLHGPLCCIEAMNFSVKMKKEREGERAELKTLKTL